MPIPTNRLVAAAVALLLSAAIVAAIVAGVGNEPGVLGGASVGRDSYCASLASASAALPAAQAKSGAYANALYGYAVTIPAGLMGFAPREGPARGLVIALPGAPAASLRVDASYDVFYDITAAGVHTRDSVDVRLFDRLLSDQGQPYALAGIEGGRYRMQVLCRDDPVLHVFDDIIVVRNREIYRLELQTRPARLPADEALLDATARSWRWIH